jgi:hypothetical protein
MVRYLTVTATAPAGASVSLTQSCTIGTAYGGGVSISGVEQADAAVAYSYPSRGRTWRAVVRARGTSPRDATLTVICVSRN